jgi:hypothetical protein
MVTWNSANFSKMVKDFLKISTKMDVLVRFTLMFSEPSKA